MDCRPSCYYSRSASPCSSRYRLDVPLARRGECRKIKHDSFSQLQMDELRTYTPRQGSPLVKLHAEFLHNDSYKTTEPCIDVLSPDDHLHRPSKLRNPSPGWLKRIDEFRQKSWKFVSGHGLASELWSQTEQLQLRATCNLQVI